MEEFKEPTVPYYAHEGMLARNERTTKRLIIALIVSVVLVFGSNALWLYAWTQYDYESEETTTETKQIDVDAKDGVANYIGNDGDITNGTDKGNDSKGAKTP
jgi:hypothetical protein